MGNPGGAESTARIRSGDNNLPTNFNLTVGSPQSRGTLLMPSLTGGFQTRHARAYIIAKQGGTFTAHLHRMDVGFSSASDSVLTGVLNLQAMESVELDVSNVDGGTGHVRVGVRTSDSTRATTGTLRLPKGTAKATQLTVGAPGAGSGLLHLDGTTFTVTGNTTVNNTGTITNNIGDVSSGLDLAADATLTVEGNGTIQLNFNAPPASLSEGHWGLRWAGDKAQRLDDDFVETGKIDWNRDDPVGSKATIYTFRGDTHIGIPPPRGSLMLFR